MRRVDTLLPQAEKELDALVATGEFPPASDCYRADLTIHVDIETSEELREAIKGSIAAELVKFGFSLIGETKPPFRVTWEFRQFGVVR